MRQEVLPSRAKEKEGQRFRWPSSLLLPELPLFSFLHL
jgi:hypothetical protein